MAELAPLQPILRGRRIAALLAALLALAATDVGAAECRGLGPRDTYLMPPPKYWGLPPLRLHPMDCDTMTAMQGTIRGVGRDGLSAEYAGCPVAALWIPPLSAVRDDTTRAVLSLALGYHHLPKAGGVMLVCTGLDRTSRQMSMVHERAHAAGWEHEDSGSRWMTARQWRAAFDAWAQARGRQ